MTLSRQSYTHLPDPVHFCNSDQLPSGSPIQGNLSCRLLEPDDLKLDLLFCPLQPMLLEDNLNIFTEAQFQEKSKSTSYVTLISPFALASSTIGLII